MPKSLVIVESPTKAKTISRFLGSGFVVDSSYGHVRDLPKSKLGVEVEKDFEPKYVIPVKAKPVIKRLKEEAEAADKVILATDEDREGESIAWHLVQALGLDKTKEKRKTERIVFHEITKKAIEEALKKPRSIDENLVNAQQTRRILDRLVGYKLSPFLWKKVFKGLSAGRVQSVTVRLIVEREREIQKFKPEEFWTVAAILSSASHDQAIKFEATLAKKDEESLDKFSLKNERDAKTVTTKLEKGEWMIEKIDTRTVNKNPLPPFTTSTLQQAAFQRLGYSAKQTMRLAQQLYEGIELGDGHVGLITYMRTDSLNLSADAVREASSFLKKELGEKYAETTPRFFKTKTKGAQEAHEAIRPTDPWLKPESVKNFLDPKQLKLYNLIWSRFIATQMPPAVFENVGIDIKTIPAGAKEKFTFRATGQTLKFDGFMKIYPSKFTENELPTGLKPEEKLRLWELKPEQHFTEPPARFSEASLIKILEQNGIGRPSTYAPTLSTIQDRGYVNKNEKRQLVPTETGFIVNDLLVEHFPKIVDMQFTAKMEEDLDSVAEGAIEWRKVIDEFYGPFAKNLEEKYEEVKKKNTIEETNEVCELCGKPMIIRRGRFGRFMACSGFPDCKNTKKLLEEPQTIGLKCSKCLEGDIIIKNTRKGRRFFGCSRYPKCDFASWQDPRQPKKEE